MANACDSVLMRTTIISWETTWYGKSLLEVTHGGRDQLSEIQTTKYDLNVCHFWLDQLLEILTTKYDHNGLQNMLN